jgi:hypothetical protein
MKNKNPLYVVKGKNVEEAQGLIDLLIKKLDLEPVIKFITQMLQILVEQVKTYPAFITIKSLIDKWMAQVLPIFQSA